MQGGQRKLGFTFIEFAVVLTICGLLIGGVMAASVMRKNLELTKISTSANHYMIAFRQFKEVYGTIPGDLATATELWGRADGGSPTSNCGAPNTTASTSRATCNGDGSGEFTWYTTSVSGPPSHEVFRAWQHLAAAGFIGGAYKGVGTTMGFVVGYSSALAMLPGVQQRAGIGYSASVNTFPPGPFPKTAFSWLGGPGRVENAVSTDVAFFDGDYTSALLFGTPDFYSTDYPMTLTAQALTTEQAYFLDQKQDDGAPATGTLRTYKGNTYNGAQNLCITNTTTSAEYNLSNTRNVCTMIFMTSMMTNRP